MFGCSTFKRFGVDMKKATYPPKKSPALIAGLIKGNQWLYNKALFLGVVGGIGRVPLGSHDGGC